MEYEVVAGIEIHVQLSTKSKLFCRCDNDSFGVKPNTNVCPICMGFPGQLPVLNEEALKKAVKAGLALNCDIAAFSKFDRKNYFYPDLPCGYQISQYDKPVCGKGNLEITLDDGSTKEIGVTRAHLEMDAGKLVHTEAGTLCDFNRSGTPLLEIVSEPDIRTMEEASKYARMIQKLVRYVNSSDCDMEKGMMRFDLNISLRPKGQKEFGTRSEIKNLNSFRSLERAFVYEMERQAKVLDAGEKVVQETRGWDDNKGQTFTQRVKEEADDYRYFPEPDLPPVTLSVAAINGLKAELPEMPEVKLKRFMEEYSMNDEDARILTSDLELSRYFEEVVSICEDSKKTISFVNTILMAKLKEDLIGVGESKVSAKQLGELIKLVNDGALSIKQARIEVFDKMYETGDDAKKVMDELGIKQMSNESELKTICEQVLAANPGPVEDFKNGKDKAFAFLVGQVMKETRGQANPGIVNKLLRELIS